MDIKYNHTNPSQGERNKLLSSFFSVLFFFFIILMIFVLRRNLFVFIVCMHEYQENVSIILGNSRDERPLSFLLFSLFYYSRWALKVIPSQIILFQTRDTCVQLNENNLCEEILEHVVFVSVRYFAFIARKKLQSIHYEWNTWQIIEMIFFSSSGNKSLRKAHTRIKMMFFFCCNCGGRRKLSNFL